MALRWSRRFRDTNLGDAGLVPTYPPDYFLPSTWTSPHRGRTVEHSSPFGTLWAGLGLGAFYLALTWVNILLGHFLTPLFLIPLTWIQDAAKGKNA